MRVGEITAEMYQGYLYVRFDLRSHNTGRFVPSNRGCHSVDVICISIFLVILWVLPKKIKPKYQKKLKTVILYNDSSKKKSPN